LGPIDLPGQDLFEPFGWIFLLLLALNALLYAMLVVLREQWWFLMRRRRRIGLRLAPVIEQLASGGDPERVAEELQPVVESLGSQQRPVAAWLLRDLVRAADDATRLHVQQVLLETGAVELAERGTRRWMPWRRALACETLGAIGAERSVPALLERLDDARGEVRTAAARALGAIGSPAAASAVTALFLERRGIPTGVAYDALRALGPHGGEAFRRGLESPDPTVRVASCFGTAALTPEDDGAGAVQALVGVLAGDENARVRTAAAKALGMVGGTTPPGALVEAADDAELPVRREAVGALGAFDAPLSAELVAEATRDHDRETALRAAESLLALTRHNHAGDSARAALASATTWSVDYARTVAELSA
jgi:HEAT repeat protein